MKIAEANSPINGQIEVHWEIGWGKTIKVDGLTQSGGVLRDIWKQTLPKLQNKDIENCLILGLGGGSAAKLVYKYWPDVKITGVDIDPVMVNLGKKYLGLNKINIKIEIQDAYQFVAKSKEKYDLVLVDLYCGKNFPEKFSDDKFLIRVKKKLNKNGIAIFNRLYGPSDRSDSIKFAKKLEKVFDKVDYFYPQANLELICYN